MCLLPCRRQRRRRRRRRRCRVIMCAFYTKVSSCAPFHLHANRSRVERLRRTLYMRMSAMYACVPQFCLHVYDVYVCESTSVMCTRVWQCGLRVSTHVSMSVRMYTVSVRALR
jgi:hypothetical protein